MNRREAQLERKRKERKGKVWREKRLEKKRCRGGERRGGVNLLKESKEKKKDEEEKNEERRRRRRGGGRKERLGTKKELGNGGETLSVGSWLAPPLVICSSDIIAACYSEAYQRTYRADYLSTDSTSLLPLSLSLFSPPSLLRPRFLLGSSRKILPVYTSFFVTLGTIDDGTRYSNEEILLLRSKVRYPLLSTLGEERFWVGERY